ncbi:MAG: sugar ABC transporter permease [Clostridia bacterium]|nr:sugar ABC transporter permease [Clostridia bacterium]
MKKFRYSRFRRELPLVIMLVPALIFVAIYRYGPMLGVVMAFQKFSPAKGFFHSKWVGLDNFRNLFSMPDIGQIIFNTVFISFFKMALGIIVPVIFALLLNEVSSSGLRRTYQTLVYLPHFLSWVILAGIFADLLSKDGIINASLVNLGFERIGFLSDQKVFPWTMIISDVWKGFGFGSIIYLAALTGIDQNLYEAAAIDGANRWKQMLHVTLPGLVSTIVLMTVLSLANILNGGFDQIYNLYRPAVYRTGDILDTFVYRLGIDNAQFSLSTAAGLFKSIISSVLIITSYRLADKFAGYQIF